MKTRVAIVGVGITGLLLILRTSAYYAQVDDLALGITVVMASVLLVGVLELWWLASHHARLQRELQSLPAIPEEADIQRLTPPLQALIRARLDRVALPVQAPVFAPYMVGLLVMLGLLGTFLGLFETLRGAAAALTTSADVEALRSGLRQPMQGLMRSFGTSAAGVAASAMLGLAAVFCRRSAAQVSNALHALVSGPLAKYSQAQRQLVALERLSTQGQAWPETARSFAEVSAKLDSLQTRWAESHDRAATVTAEEIKSAGFALLREIERTLTEVHAISDRNEQALSGLSDRWEQAHQTAATSLANAVEHTLQRLASTLEEGVTTAAARTSEQLSPLLQENARQTAATTAGYLQQVQEQSEALLQRLDSRQAEQQQQEDNRLAQLQAQLAAAVQAVAELTEETAAREQERGKTASELVQRVKHDLEQAMEILNSRQEALAGLEEAQQQRMSELMTQLEQVTGMVHETISGQSQAVERLAVAATERLAEGQTQAQEQLQSFFAGIEQAAQGQAEQMAVHQKEWLDLTTKAGKELLKVENKLMARHETLVQKSTIQGQALLDRLTDVQKALAEQQVVQTAALAEVLEKQFATLQEKVEQSANIVAESTALIQGGGAELVTVAETFGAAVEQQRLAGQQWLESLGSVERLVTEAGEAAAADVLGQHLARTHEVFDRQLQFQQALIEQLRGATKAEASTPPDDSPSDTNAEQVVDASV